MSTGDRAGEGASQGSGSQTLDRGLRLLELLASEDRDMTVAELATSLGMHRQAVYRLLTTLRLHRLAAEGSSGRYRLGLGVIQLARQANPQLRRAVVPYLRTLAEELGVTTQCVVAEGADAVVLAVVEPPDAIFHLSQRSGARHALDQGASGLAIMLSRPPQAGDPPAVTEARELGYAVSRGTLTPGAVGVAVPLYDSEGHSLDASLGIVSMVDLEVERTAKRLLEAAAQITAREL
ncbi:IclR family transcriptional regulator [Nonomuraea fuscirosea]|uniref:IclR family transcriptional regulator n=1 Tax=Nonomuraea fuscirosea TaxID=1291556 RepID=A0A2T0MQ82_9ACTN|nr:helix-turn-helix domain-containing protein [Nonomuraea fuscirosea]PRX60266.1 IclR family transcriptional regulator [Nonomuraea fuscirosea]WSA56000.1 helix-turn-helix domain-containing protein [Nonomuraea fuscirosea]